MDYKDLDFEQILAIELALMLKEPASVPTEHDKENELPNLDVLCKQSARAYLHFLVDSLAVTFTHVMVDSIPEADIVAVLDMVNAEGAVQQPKGKPPAKQQTPPTEVLDPEMQTVVREALHARIDAGTLFLQHSQIDDIPIHKLMLVFNGQSEDIFETPTDPAAGLHFGSSSNFEQH